MDGDRRPAAVCDVVGDDGGNDGAGRKPDGLCVRDHQSPATPTSAPYVPTAVFLLGYLIVWAGFSVVATALQWLLQSTGLLTTMMQSTSHYWSAALFLAAGLYQFSPLKERCLAYCRTPDSFILTEWRDGASAPCHGLRHGQFCLGCCGALMVLLFAVAVMDLRWVALLTALVTAEKLLPGASFWRAGIGLGLIVTATGFAIAAGADDALLGAPVRCGE